MDILNLPGWQIAGVTERPESYVIAATYETAPNFCAKCACVANFYEFGSRTMTVTDLPIHGKQVTIEANRKRYRCRECGYTFTADNHLIDERRHLTNRLVEYIQRESFKRTFTGIADEISLHEKTIRNVFNEYVEELDRTIQFETPRWLGIDELHLLHRARCVIGNVEKRTIVDMLDNRNKPTVVRRLQAFPDRQQIELVCMDMWNAYREAVHEALPQARIVADKFHVVKMANKAVETIRKRIRAGLSDKERRSLMHDRFALLKRERDLTFRQHVHLNMWRANYPELAQAHERKEELFTIWETRQSRVEAERQYDDWVTKLGDVAPAFMELTRAVENWREEAFTYFELPVTNAYTEALNGLTKLANRNGRGYSFKVIRAKMLYAPDNRPPPTYEQALDEIGRKILAEYAQANAISFRATPNVHGVDIGIARYNIEMMTQVSTSKGEKGDDYKRHFSTTKSE